MHNESSHSAGRKFRKALENETPLQIVGAINAYCAIQAEKAGFQALYLSGAGVSNYSLGAPDDGQTLNLDEIRIDARRILAKTTLPLLVDVDTGFDDPEDTVATLSDLGVAGVHMEDQVPAKLCGHLPGKQIVSKDEMAGRIKAALKGKTDPDFVVMARCDALASEGLDGFIERATHYAQAGADMIFAEAMTDLDHYRQIKQAVDIPLLANLTEFGKTRLYTCPELGKHGVDMALYPLSAVRGMTKAAQTIYATIRRDGTQAGAINMMQPRDTLYATLQYDAQVEDAAPMKRT